MIHVASSPLAFGNMRFVMAVVHDQVFYFQAEDGIRDGHVTGVQTCALPIFTGIGSGLGTVLGGVGGPAVTVYAVLSRRSEERRVGKEWSAGRLADCGERKRELVDKHEH